MTGRQTDKYTMLLVVASFLKNTDEETIAKMPHFAQILIDFNLMTNKLDLLNGKQNLNRTGTRKAKLNRRAQMTILAITIASTLEAYAIAINDKVLQQKVTFKEYLLKKSRENTIGITCQYIHKIATELLPQLAAYGITAQSLADFNQSITDYTKLVPKTRIGIVTRSSCTRQIKELLTDFDTLLIRMDKLVNILRFSHPTFYKNYFSNRKTITRGTRKQVLRGIIKDQNGNPLDRVEVTINTTPNKTTKTGNKGHYHFKNLPGGVWEITVAKLGYETQTIYRAIIPTSPQEFNLQLKPVENLQTLVS